MSTSEAVNQCIKRIMDRAVRVVTVESRQKCADFIPRPSDVIVVGPIKCGTTWMTQIVHQLRSGGDMSFNDLDDEAPWIDSAYDCGFDLDADQNYEPRCFKTHSSYDGFPKGAKYVVIYRDPCGSFYSAFKFFQRGKYFGPGEITLDDYVKQVHLFLGNDKKSELQRGNYFNHLLGWWPHRNDPNVLFLLYEDMLENLEAGVRQIALFMGVDDENRIANAVKMSTFDFMKQHESQFTMNRLARYRNKELELDEDALLVRVATGSATKGREMMSDSIKNDIQKTWEDTITKQIGFKDYEDLRNALKKERQPDKIH